MFRNPTFILKKRVTISILTAILVPVSLFLGGSWSESRANTPHAEPIMLMLETASNDTMVIKSQVAINAPSSVVWSAMTNYNGLKDYLPGYRKSQLVQNQPKLVDVGLSVSPFLPVYHYRVRVQEDPQSLQLHFNRISGDFKAFSAVYSLVPKDNGTKTILVYQLKIDPGVHLPGSDTLLKNTTQKTLAALRTYSEQEYRKSLIGQR